MNRRGTIIQGGLAAGSLALAFMLAQRQSVGMNDGVVLEARSADIQSLKYFDGKRHYLVTPDPTIPGDLLIHVSAGERVMAGGSAAEKLPERDLKGGHLALNLWNAFAPLKAMRTLGKLPAEKLKALGLTDTTRRLTVRVRGIDRTFRLATPPPGAVEPYLMSESDGSVFVVSRLIMNSFSERALGPDRVHNFALHEFDRFTLTPVGKAPVKFKAVRGLGTESTLVPESAISANITSIASWHAGAFHATVDDALGQGESPKDGEPQVQYRLEYWLGRDRQGWMDLAVANYRGQPRLYFRSEQSLGWMIGGPGSQETLAQAKVLFPN